jgi:regulator of protease activity HflC (stomatin/prohibitin superfamily)
MYAIAGGRLLPVGLVAAVGAAILLALAIRTEVHGEGGGGRSGFWIGAALLAVAAAGGLRGLTRLGPGEAVVVQLFGRYLGTVREPGQWWVNPQAKRRKVSTRVRTHETAVLKVNDTEGVPIEIAMAVSWQVNDTAKALFAVEDYQAYVRSQCERALRQVAADHPYEPDGEGGKSLSTSAAMISDELLAEVAGRVEPAGIAVVECQLVRIAYAAEIAQAMLRRQQAAAVVAARQHIVEGAVGMVELALQRLGDRHVVDLDEERKATMVSNLMVVLCSDHPTQPMVNAGSLYL